MRPYALLLSSLTAQRAQACILSAVYALKSIQFDLLYSPRRTHVNNDGNAAAVLLVQHVKDRGELKNNSRSGEYRGRTDDLLHAMQAL